MSLVSKHELFYAIWVICFLWDANAKEAVSNDSVNFISRWILN